MNSAGAYIWQLVAVVSFLIVGARLLRLSRRTREAPEKLLGLYFFASGLAFLGWTISTIFDFEGMEAQIDPVIWFDLVPWAVYGIGMVPLMLFTRVVFRPGEAWAKWMIGACTLLLFSATTMWFVQRPDYYSINNPWYWCEWLGYTIPYCWVTIEAFVSYSGASRRARVGLCDRVVANRYLLFGWFGAVHASGCVTDIFEAMEYAANQTVTVGIDFAMGAAQLAGIVILFLVFFPPAVYQRWISAEPATGAVDG